MEELNLEQMETTIGGQFWGYGNCKAIPGTMQIIEHNGGAYDCVQQWECQAYYVFWIDVGGGTISAGCDW